MQLPTLLVALAAAFATVSHAQFCTEAELNGWRTSAAVTKVKELCDADITDPKMPVTNEFCLKTECVTAVEAAYEIIPMCFDKKGTHAFWHVSFVLDECADATKVPTAGTSSASSDGSTPTTTTRPPISIGRVSVPATGDECTDAHLEGMSKISDAVMQCAEEFRILATVPDPAKFCSESECINNVKSTLASLPNCTLNATDVSFQLDLKKKMLDQVCTVPGVKSSGGMGISGAPASVKPSSAMGISGASAVAVATAAVVLAFTHA